MKSKLKAMSCNSSQVHAELCAILLSYRKTVYPATGYSPSMMVFGRQIRSRLDLMIPSDDPKGNEIEGKVREFQLGTRVLAREYVHENKWELGLIKQRFGKLHYLILLDDGRQWKRHVDQLRGVGSSVGSEVESFSTYGSVSRGDVYLDNSGDTIAEAFTGTRSGGAERSVEVSVPSPRPNISSAADQVTASKVQVGAQQPVGTADDSACGKLRRS